MHRERIGGRSLFDSNARTETGGPKILKQLVFLDGRQHRGLPVAILPSLSHLRHGMSVGPGAMNMAESFERGNIPGVQDRVERFLQAVGASSLEKSFLMLRAKRGESPIVDITPEMIAKASQRPKERADLETVLPATEAMITTESVPLMAKLADCYPMIIYGKTNAGNGKPVVALLHLSRDQIDNLLIEKVITHLANPNTYGCNPKDLQVGIFPGMGYEHNTIRAEDEDKFLTKGHWDKFMERRSDGYIYLDPLGNIFDQLRRMGIADCAIEAYGDNDAVDTFGMAQMDPPQAFSQRYATHTKQPNRNGRNLIVVQLPTV